MPRESTLSARLLGPLRPIAQLALVALLALSASRAILVALYRERLSAVPQVRALFVVGLRLDTMTLGWLLLPAVVVLVLWPRRPGRVLATLVAAYLALATSVLAFVEIATYPFLAQYDRRPNHLFVDYLAYPRELVGTIWADHALAVVVAVIVVAVVGWGVVGLRAGIATPWSWRCRLLVGGLGIAGLFLAARSSIGPRGGNISTAAFTADHLANELALNSTYAVGYALDVRLRHEEDPATLYGHMPDDEAVRRVRAATGLPPAAFPRDDVPFLHRQASATPRARPCNLVVFLQESLGAQYVGALGGLDLTPNLDALAHEGLLFTNLFATGTRTVRGIEAVVAGLPPTPSSSIVKLGVGEGTLFTLATLLRAQGYATEFLYGGDSDFDNMRGFMLSEGFERVIDESAFRAPVFHGVWGVSDEDLVRKANATFVAHGDRPFFALLLSTSNHPPFEYPEGRITLFEEPARTQHNAITYADWAIGQLFALARREAYFRDTVFLVVADHDTRVYGEGLLPVAHFHIPALVIGPGVAPRRDDRLASQIDLPPTLLDLIGLDVDTPLVGRDLVQPPDLPGRAIMQYDLTNGYRVGDDVVVLEPHEPAQQFRWRDGVLVPAPLVPELAHDALAHVEAAAMVVREGRHRARERPAG